MRRRDFLVFTTNTNTEEIKAPFVSAEFVERIAGIVAYYIGVCVRCACLIVCADKIVGPAVSEIKVRDRAKVTHTTNKYEQTNTQNNNTQYDFEPRRLLAEIIGIFLHLSDSQEFLKAVAMDTRSVCWFVFHNIVLLRFGLFGCASLKMLCFHSLLPEPFRLGALFVFVRTLCHKI